MFDGKVVLVSGAGGGMGRAAALAFAGQGASLAILDVAEAALQETARLLAGRPIVSGLVDLRNPAAIAAFMDQVEGLLGPVEILAHTAGVWHSAPYDRVSESEWDLVLDVNLKGSFFLCQAAMNHMRKLGRGAIVNVASTAGEYGSVRPAAPYAASKGGLIALSKSLAREGAPHIRVNVVSPGPTDTPMLASTEAEKQEIAKRPLVGRLGTPEDMAAAILYLSGPQAGFITGEVLRVNGGSLI